VTGLLLSGRLRLSGLLLARWLLAGLRLTGPRLARLHRPGRALGVARAIPLALLTAAIPAFGASLATVIADAVLVFLVHSESSIL